MPNEHEYILTGAAVAGPQLIYVRGVLAELNSENLPHSFIAKWYDGKWAQGFIPNGITSQCIIMKHGATLVSLCTDGQVYYIDERGRSSEYIDEHLRDARTWMLDIENVDGTLYAAGMSRKVYKKKRGQRWTPIDERVIVSNPDEIGAGFRSLHGISGRDIYAVGFGGEVYRLHNEVWHKINDVTNARLDCVRCINRNQVVICGAHGTIISGSGQSWKFVEQDLTERDFVSMEPFGSGAYLADGKNLYFLHDNELTRVKIKVNPSLAPIHLSVYGTTLGITARHAVVLYNGSEWRELPLPGGPKS